MERGDGLAQGGARGQSLVLMPPRTREAGAGVVLWSLKANHAFTEALLRDASNAEIAILGDKEASVMVNGVEFSMKLFDVEHSEVFQGPAHCMEFVGMVDGRYTITSTTADEGVVLRGPASGASAAPRKRTVAAIDGAAPRAAAVDFAPKAKPRVAPSANLPEPKKRRLPPPPEPIQLALNMCAVKLVDLPLQTTPGDVMDFFSGLKFSTVYLCIHVTKSSEIVCSAYVKFESCHGAELALQREGERLRSSPRPTHLEAVGPWEIMCAEALGLCPSESSTSARDLLGHMRAAGVDALMACAAPETVAEFWRRELQSNSATALVTPLSDGALQEQLRISLDLTLVQQVLAVSDADDVDYVQRPMESGPWPGLVGGLLRVRRQLTGWCAAELLVAEQATLLTTAQRGARLYEKLGCALWRLAVLQRDLSLCAE